MRSATLLTTTLGLLLTASTALAATRIQITNVNEQPIAGATVHIQTQGGNKPGHPPLQTDVNGYVVIPDGVTRDLDLTVAAQGYITTSFVDVENNNTVLQLHRQDSRQAFEIRGEAINFKNIKKDGKVDFGLVYPALSRRDLLQFDVSSVVSPETDRIKVVTQNVDLPSNLTLPDQQESYVLPVRLNKPVYRMYVPRAGTYRMTATHGQFPLKQVISDMQNGKSIFEVLNHFNFLNAGQREVTVNGNISGQDIDVNNITFDASVEVQAPAIPAEHAMVSATLVDQGGAFFPADLKSLKSNATQTLNLPASAGQNAYILSLMTADRKAGGSTTPMFDGSPKDIGTMLEVLLGRLRDGVFQLGNPPEPAVSPGVSIALQATAARVTPQFLDIVAAPQATPEKIVLQPPASKSAIVPVATYAILSEVTVTQNGNFRSEKRFRLWEVFQGGWASEIQLPTVELPPKEEGKLYRWEVLFLGKAPGVKSGDYFLDGVTHVSRTSLDL